MADSTSLPQVSLDKPPPYSVPESGDQGDFALTIRQQPERVTDESAPEDPPMSLKLAQWMTKFAQTIGNFSVAQLVAFLIMVAKGIRTILWEIPSENIREREEIKEKEKEIRDIQMKEIVHLKGKLEEKIRKAHETDNFTISKVESDKWEWILIKTKDLVAKCGLDITYLQGLVGRLESEARLAVWWMTFQLITGLLVCGMIYYYWGNVSETGETGTTGQSVTVSGVLVLGMAILCARNAPELYNNRKLVGECKEDKRELERTKLDYMKYKHSVEITLPEQKKLLSDVSLYSSPQRFKYKDD